MISPFRLAPRAARCVMVVFTALLLGTSAAPAAHAHPLGNFSLNHHDGLRLFPDRVEDVAVVDSAEIPTAQNRETADRNGDGTVSRAEAAHSAKVRCTRLARAMDLSVDGERRPWQVRGSRLLYRKGAAGLPITRLTCRLRAVADLSDSAEVTFTSGAEAARTGWKEITATGLGVNLAKSDVPARSSSDGLRDYPSDAADEPLNQTGASLKTVPDGKGGGTATEDAEPGAAPSQAEGAVLFPALEQRLTSLATGHDLTPPVGLLAILLTVLLGAGHAALPGHAKLAVAACLARREGGVRAALTVGATVTATHTAGVLAVGLVLTVSGGLLGEQLLGWLGAISGVIIAAIGTGLVITAARALSADAPTAGRHHHGHTHRHPGPGHRHHGHSHDHSHGHAREHAHTPDHSHEPDRMHGHTRDGARGLRLSSLLGVGLAGGLVPSPSALVVLLGAVALSRTFFGVLLVLGYGLGMATTLTAAGLLLSGGGSRLAMLGERRLPALRRYMRYGTLLTALAVLLVGLGLVLRSLVAL
ncbi:nickel transporter [Streptomyces sp. NBC_01775]|uniref:nickel transporter n=1 Tax=Streptomyces sp. NBC_01775 TaxID=2975939 RepID=UPI002DDA1815|nr:nickel transporter [Streptomyces sp. NBC_01775]WSB76152.1 nickel transporter [Streptomyces sp. NBC_01775]